MFKKPPISSQIYDAFAPYYRHYSKSKSRYLDSIDRLVISNLPAKTKKILDVGCGDGVRGVGLFAKSRADELWMIDESTEMYRLALIHKKENTKILQLDISNKSQASTLPSEYFDAVLCLWNVLGHITEYTKRVEAMSNIKKLLRKNGRLLFDVNSRHNISSYGLKIVGKNLWNDLMKPSSDNGNVECMIHANGCDIESYCHFFNPREIVQICKNVGLKIIKIIYVNYNTGEITNKWGGQIFCVIEDSK